MSASEHLQPEQLRMFMSADHIMKNYPPGDHHLVGDTYGETEQSMWEDKRSENEDHMDQSVMEHGVKKPVVLHRFVGSDQGYLGNGHHRVAAQHDADPQRLVPVLHHEGAVEETWRHKGTLKHFPQ